jgi:hypothetical protein
MDRSEAGHGRTLSGWLVALRDRLIARDELAGMADNDVERMLQDLGLNRQDLDSLTHAGKGPTELMPQRLASQGIDPQTLMRFEAAVYRDLQRVCSKCMSTGRCQRELAAGDTSDNWKHYCLNVDTIESLAKQPGSRKA